MQIEFIEAGKASEFENDDLRSHAEQCALSKATKLYRVLRDGEEVAFLALDRVEGLESLVPYDLYVAPSFRRSGIGNATMEKLEQIAMEEGCHSVRLAAHPTPGLDGPSTGQLQAWFDRRGYVDHPSGANQMEKRLKVVPFAQRD